MKGFAQPDTFLQSEKTRAPGPSKPRAILLLSLLVLLILGLAADPLAGQSSTEGAAEQKPDISVNVKMVHLLATVRNKKGDIVRNLTKGDFVLDEDGAPQTIEYFTQESDLALTLGLLVDTSMSQRQVLGDEQKASHAFFDRILREDKDRAFVIHFDHEVELLQDLTASRQKLESSLELLDTPDREGEGYGLGHGGAAGGHGRGRGGFGGGTLLYDAIYLASNEVMKKQQGRKALIVLTDGVDHGSKESLETAIESAERSDVLVYTILFTGEKGAGRRGLAPGGGLGGGWPGHGDRHRGSPDPPTDGKKVLERLSQDTGAHMYEVSKKESMEEIYARIEEELRHQYSVGYAPNRTDQAPGYRKIHLSTRQSELTVQTRDGYYSER